MESNNRGIELPPDELPRKMLSKLVKYEFEALEQLLEQYSDRINDSVNDSGMSIFSTACSLNDDGSQAMRDKNLRMLNLINRFNPSFDHQDKYQRSPLHNATKSKNFTAIQFLFEHGDKDKFIDLQSMGGVTALMNAAE